MNLYINTSGEHCEIGLFGDQILAHEVHSEPMEHSTVLHDMINDMLKNAQVKLQDLKSIAVLNGPGSYTGLRIGLAAAKGFCYALDIPLILFNKLKLTCDYYNSLNKSEAHIATIETARQGEHFFYLEGANGQISEPLVRTTEFINEQINTYPNIQMVSTSSNTFDDIEYNVEQLNISIEFIAGQISKRLDIKQLDDAYRAEPFYLKKVHANQPKKRF